jgi:hypothetical protein
LRALVVNARRRPGPEDVGRVREVPVPRRPFCIQITNGTTVYQAGVAHTPRPNQQVDLFFPSRPQD